MTAMRGIIAGIGAMSAAAAAVVTGISLRHSEEDNTPAILIEDLQAEICLRTSLKFFENAKQGCVKKSELQKWIKAPVLDNVGAPVTLNMSHPTDYSRELSVVKTCEDYRLMTKVGWYAGSTREMRREAYFERACGALTYLALAKEPDISYFTNGSSTRSDLASLADGPPFKIAPRLSEAPEEIDISQLSDGVWRISTLGQNAQLQEIAHADFNGDGIGDILTFVSIGVEDATATAGMVGYLEKKSARAAVEFSQ